MAIELLFVLLLAYLLLGPKKSVGLAHKAGGMLAQFNKVKADFKASMQKELASIDSNSGIVSEHSTSSRPKFSLFEKDEHASPSFISSTASSTVSSHTAVPSLPSLKVQEAIYDRESVDQIDRS